MPGVSVPNWAGVGLSLLLVTGLILAGVDPLTAIRYQIVVMYMLLVATALAALTSAQLAEHALFDHAHHLIPLTT